MADHERKVALMQKAVATFEDGAITHVTSEHVDASFTLHRYFKDDTLTLCGQFLGESASGFTRTCAECSAIMKRIRQVRGDEGRRRKAAQQAPIVGEYARIRQDQREELQSMPFSELLNLFIHERGRGTSKELDTCTEIDRRISALETAKANWENLK